MKMEFRDAILMRGDCLELMPACLQADHVISDPPYEDELHGAMGRIRRNDGQDMVQDLGFAGINTDRAEVAKLCATISQGWTILFTLAEGVREWRDCLQRAGAKYDTCLFWIQARRDPANERPGGGPWRGVCGHGMVRHWIPFMECRRQAWRLYALDQSVGQDGRASHGKAVAAHARIDFGFHQARANHSRPVHGFGHDRRGGVEAWPALYRYRKRPRILRSGLSPYREGSQPGKHFRPCRAGKTGEHV